MLTICKSMAALLPTAGALSGIDDVCVRGFGIADTASSSLWEGRMRPGQASQTLLITSIMRARHQLFDTPTIQLSSVWCPRRATLAYFLILAIPESRRRHWRGPYWLCAAGSPRIGWRRLRRAASVNMSCSVLVSIPSVGSSLILQSTFRFLQSIIQRAWQFRDWD